MSIARCRRAAAVVAVAAAALSVLPIVAGSLAPRAEAATVRAMRFPVKGPVSYVDTWGACRDGCTRQHQGTDIFAPKLRELVAANDGYISWVRTDSSGTSGNGLSVTDAEGWRYLYLHVNNDTPGTDDGANPARWRFAPGIELGKKVYGGQVIAYLGDSGNAEGTPPHVHFELRKPDGVTINPYPSLLVASTAPPDPRLYRFDALRATGSDDHVQWGSRSSTVLACDMDGDGADEPVRFDAGTFSWAPGIIGVSNRRSFRYGTEGDVPLCGDWDGDGTDTVGVRRGAKFLLRNSNSGGGSNVSFGYGIASDAPVVGDWDGDGTSDVGVVRDARWLLRTRLAPGSSDIRFVYGVATDIPVIGDWDGDGDDDPALRRGRTTYLRYELSGGSSDRRIASGMTSDVAVAAHWATADAPGDSINLWRPRPA